MPKRFTITLNDRYRQLLDELNGSHGDKSNFLRLSLQAHLIRMTPVQYAAALGQEKGPHPHKVSFNTETQEAKWYAALTAKAKVLETTPAELARACLCQFLEDLLEDLKERKEIRMATKCTFCGADALGDHGEDLGHLASGKCPKRSQCSFCDDGVMHSPDVCRNYNPHSGEEMPKLCQDFVRHHGHA